MGRELGPLLPGTMPDSRTHSDGKFVDGDTAEPGSNKVPPLMGSDQDAEKKDGDDNIHSLGLPFLVGLLRSAVFPAVTHHLTGGPVCFQYILQTGI